ncbi:SBBP repeat-containing protein [Dolichospermum sp. ST_sed1]|nr:SBBP repeat-containing protein [Dolichospermum sp. ST_sed1]
MKSIDPSLTTGLKMIPSINSDQITAITTGSDGAIYVSGYTYRNLDGQTNNGNWDAFITKYLPDGTKSWTNLLGGSEHDQFTSLTTDSDGAIYVSGYTYGDIDGQTNNGGADAFITKYLPDGTKSWTNLFEGSDYNIAAGMTTGGDCATYPSYIDSNLDEETNNGIDDGSNGIDDG